MQPKRCLPLVLSALCGAVDDTTVAPDGTISVTVQQLYPESIEPVVEKKMMQIKGILSGQILAEVPFEVTNLAVKTVPPTASYHKVVTYMFAGFRPHKPIFGHFFRGGKLAVTHKFGKSTGPCGTLHAKSKLFPGNGPPRRQVQGPVRRLQVGRSEGHAEDRDLPRLRLLTAAPDSPKTL